MEQAVACGVRIIMKPCDEKSPKKPYHSPRLLVYGDLRALTKDLKGGKIVDNVQMMNQGKDS